MRPGRIPALALVPLLTTVPAASHELSVTVTEGTNIAVTAAPRTGVMVLDLQGKLFTLTERGGRARPFSDDFLDPFWPDLAPDGQRVAVQSFIGGIFHIWTLTAEGRDLHQVTFGEYDDKYPAWSPDGRRIAFTSARAGADDIWVVDVPTGDLRRVTAGSQPTWSPDGREIGYVRANQVEAVSLDTGAVRTLVPAEKGGVTAPSWSPDGHRVAFVRGGRLMVSTGGPATVVGGDDDVFGFPPEWLSADSLLYGANGKIVIGRLDGSSRTVPFSATFTLTRDDYRRKTYDFDQRQPQPAHGIVGPALSPDGRTVVFKALNDLWLMPIGSTPRKFTDDPAYETDPAWSPDGRQIAYASDKAGTEDLYVRSLTGQERRVTSLPGAEVAPTWSPDGNRLAFQDQASQTQVVDLATGAVTRLLAPSFSVPGRPSWSPDGRTVAMAVSAGERNQIQLTDVATGTSRLVEPKPFGSVSTRGDDGPVWSPDGRELAFIMESTLWVLPVRPDGTPTGPARQVTHEASDAPTWGGNSLLYLHNGTLRMSGRDVPVNLTYTPRHKQGVTVIHAGKLWDGEGHDLKSDVDVVVVGDRIRAVEPHRADRPSVDATGLTVMPGLVDMHNHQEMRSKYFGDRQGRLLLSYGITTTRSTGDAAYRALEDKESLAAGARIGPRFFMTGEMLEGPRLSWEFARPVISEAQLGLEMSRAKALDYDLVKTYQRLPAKWQADVAADAHRLGVITTSHYLYPGVAHGVDMQEHLSGPTKWGFGFSRNTSSRGRVYDDVVQLFTRAGMPLSTTLFGSKALLADDPAMVGDPRVRALYTPTQQATLDADLKCALGTGPCGFLAGDAAETEREVAVFKRILDHGGTVVAGTDAPLDNTAVSLHLNLRAMNKYGIDSYRVLRGATADAARVLGVDRDLGTIRPGKLADMSFVVGDPLADVAAAANVRMVMKNGELHTVADLIGPFE